MTQRDEIAQEKAKAGVAERPSTTLAFPVSKFCIARG